MRKRPDVANSNFKNKSFVSERPRHARSTFEIIIVLRKHERGACVCLFVYSPVTSYVYSRGEVGEKRTHWNLNINLYWGNYCLYFRVLVLQIKVE